MVFTPFAQALPLIEAVLAPLGAIWTLRGGLASKVMGERVAAFQAAPRADKALLCTIGVGSSFTATAASTAFFLGSAWSPAHNIQCEDRLHRWGQRDTVLVKYLVGENTIDEHVLDILNDKSTYAALALRPDMLLRPRAAQMVPFAEAG
jgi:SNF2 family DNA or RNA helicase